MISSRNKDVARTIFPYFVKGRILFRRLLEMELKSSFRSGWWRRLADDYRRPLGSPIGKKRATHRSDWCSDSPMKSSPMEKRFSKKARAHLGYAFVRINFDHGFAPTKRTRNKFSLFFPFVLDKKKRETKEHSVLRSIYRFEISKFADAFRNKRRIKRSGRCAEADAANASPPLANLVSTRLENRTRAIPAMISLRGTGLKACSQPRAHPNRFALDPPSKVSLVFLVSKPDVFFCLSLFLFFRENIFSSWTRIC